VVSQARLLNSMYYSGMDFTYKLDRTTLTVGAPSWRYQRARLPRAPLLQPELLLVLRPQ
jgi:hypothetical protein